MKKFKSTVLLLAVILLTYSYVNQVFANNDKKDIYTELKAFTDVLAIVQSDYVNEPNAKTIVEGAIKGMLTELDPHSTYISPEHYNDLEVQTKGKFGGLGIEISRKDGQLVVITPMEDSPAAQVGVEAGDLIVKIEEDYTKDLTLNEAVSKLRGPKGEPITISVQRKGYQKLINFTIIRDIIKIKNIKKRYLGDGLAYIRIAQFMENTANDFKKAVDSIISDNNLTELKGLIIDVRNNPGGLLTEVVRLSDYFLKEGVIVYTKGRLKDQQQKFYAKDTKDEPSFPVVVLINGGSASASEILAATFKDHGRGIVIGTESFGKGSVQTVTPLKNGGALTLTTALYYTKSGHSIQNEGVTPDIEVIYKKIKREDLDTSDFEGFKESDLKKAIKNPNKIKREKKKGKEVQKDKKPKHKLEYERIDPEKTDLKVWLKRDNQLEKGIEVLKNFEEVMKEKK